LLEPTEEKQLEERIFGEAILLFRELASNVRIISFIFTWPKSRNEILRKIYRKSNFLTRVSIQISI
jgi:hypothetical protein